MEFQVRQLVKRLNHLGYRGYEIGRIVKEAVGSERLDMNNHGQCVAAVAVMRKYERLGRNYMHQYSK